MNRATAKSTEDLFSGVLKYIEDCRAHLAQGELLEMTGLEKDVATLCASIDRLPEAERLQHASRVKKLFEELSRLGEELKKSRAALETQMRAVDDYRRANIAYRTSDARDDFGESGKKGKK